MQIHSIFCWAHSERLHHQPSSAYIGGTCRVRCTRGKAVRYSSTIEADGGNDDEYDYTRRSVRRKAAGTIAAHADPSLGGLVEIVGANEAERAAVAFLAPA